MPQPYYYLIVINWSIDWETQPRIELWVQVLRYNSSDLHITWSSNWNKRICWAVSDL